MATLKDIKVRMGSIKNTQQITKAMKMVSASKMKKAEDKIKEARPYSVKLREMVENLAGGVEESAHPLLTQREGGNAVVLLITTDRGLCGGLNANLCKELLKIQKDPDAGVEFFELISVGRKGFEFFQSRDINIIEKYGDLKNDELVASVTEVVRKLIQQYTDGKFDKLFFAFNTFKNVISQEATITQVLPIQPPTSGDEVIEETLKSEFIFEESRQAILDSILPQFVENQAFTALLDNTACEHAARMTAMDAATRNAGDILSALQLKYNRARQAAITTELIEIISGAESL